MSDTIFQVQLKQHTPIIHFQPHQKGATLRATEIKSAMNKILPTKKKYQIKVVLKNSPKKENPNKNLLFFGNMGIDDKHKWKKTFEKQDVCLHINSYFDIDLKDKIEKKMPIALALNNFGTRNNKGTGCYFPEKIYGRQVTLNNFQKIIKDNNDLIGQDVYYWDCENYESIYDVFREIKYFYSLLKSGVNLSRNIRSSTNNSYNKKYEVYHKPILYYHFLSEYKITWEKRRIKEFFEIKDGRSRPKSETNDYHFIRSLLGTSDVQEWVGKYHKKLHVTFPNGYKRIPSSMIFKVFVYNEDNNKLSARIYFWINDSYKKILGEEFSFKFADGHKSLPLKAPSSFNPNKFLEFVSNNIATMPMPYNDGEELLNVLKTIKDDEEKRYLNIIYEVYKTLYDIKKKGVKICPKE